VNSQSQSQIRDLLLCVFFFPSIFRKRILQSGKLKAKFTKNSEWERCACIFQYDFCLGGETNKRLVQACLLAGVWQPMHLSTLCHGDKGTQINGRWSQMLFYPKKGQNAHEELWIVMCDRKKENLLLHVEASMKSEPTVTHPSRFRIRN